METVFNNYINEQVDKKDKEVIKLRRRKVLCTFGDDLNNKYLQSLLVNKDFISSRL